jgi:hypothetical protein
MKILCKYPTRGRPQFFLQRLKEWTDLAEKPQDIAWLVSYDSDDATMTPEVIAQAETIHPSVICVKGESKTKIAACNADIGEYAADWSVVLLVSDDFFCRRKGWDEIIRTNMARYFPDTDGALWFFDGSQKHINTLECVGRKRYEHFGYIYHPAYRSFFCDNESSAVGTRDNKLVRIEQPIATHEHPSWGRGMRPDATYKRNNPHWAHDQALFTRRQAAGFPK